MMKTNNLGIYIHIPYCRSKCPYCDFYSVVPRANYDKKPLITAICQQIDDFFTVKSGLSPFYQSKVDNFEKISKNSQQKNDFSIKKTEIIANNSTIVDNYGHNSAICQQETLYNAKTVDYFDKNIKKSQKNAAKTQNGDKELESNDTCNTIFIGGGTPNTLKIDELSLILDRIKDNIGGNLDCIDEITIEFNPFKADNQLEYLKSLRKLGINRLSIGAQSFNPGLLMFLGRLHDRNDIISTVNHAKEAGFDNISLDLMFGIPGQTVDNFLESVKEAISLDVQHISMYSLEFMEGTRFTKQLEMGYLKETDPEIDRKMYHEAIKLLEEAGFVQYEISNLAKPGFESKHNLKYWNLEEYIGFGPSAHSFIKNKDGEYERLSIISNIDEYIKNPLKYDVYEKPTKNGLMSEYTFTGLRKNDGISFADFRERFEIEFFEAFNSAKKELEPFIKDGYVLIDDKCIRLSISGFDISNKILSIFV